MAAQEEYALICNMRIEGIGSLEEVDEIKEEIVEVIEARGYVVSKTALGFVATKEKL